MARFKNGNLILEDAKSVVSGDESIVPIRNLIINGDFNIWQRGTGSVALDGTPTYNTADRWANEMSGSGSSSVNATGTSPDNFRTSLQFVSSDTSSKNVYAWQRIEGDNFRPLIGETVFVGAWVGASVSTGSFIYIYSNPGGRDVWADAENTTKTLIKVATTDTLTADTWTFISTTFTVTDQCKNGVAIGYRIGPFTSAANAYLTGARAHKGETKIPWNILTRPQEAELALCQRYFEKSYKQGDAPGVATTNCAIYYIAAKIITNGYGWGKAYFRVIKRTSPTVTVYSPSTGTAAKLWNQTKAGDYDASAYAPHDAGFVYLYSDATPTADADIMWMHWAADAEL